MKTWSVQIGPDYHDDTFLGGHDECLAYAKSLISEFPDADIRIAEIEDENGMSTYVYDIEEIRYTVEFGKGESREVPGRAAAYMIADVDGMELYAEIYPKDDDMDSFDELASAIMSQAEDNNILPEKLYFKYN